jgi:Fe-S-cluster-containing dehydrogenase component
MTGSCLVDWDKCIGCKYCMIACPYGVRFYMDEKPLIEPTSSEVFPGDGERIWNPPYKMPDAVEDRSGASASSPRASSPNAPSATTRSARRPRASPISTRMIPRPRSSRPPACGSAPPKARYFGDLDNPDSQVNQLIADRKGGVRLKEETGNKPKVYYLGAGASIPAFKPAPKA